MRRVAVCSCLVLSLTVLVTTPAPAQDRPRSGGELIFVVPSEPPSYDGHQEETFGVAHPLAPHYNGIMRIDPFDRTGTDKRARRALTLALDRYEGSRNLSRVAIVRDVAGIQVPGTQWATPPEELEKLAGYGRDTAKNRAEARRLLREAGLPDGYAFTFIEASAYHPMLKRGDFDVAMDFQCNYVVEPDIDLGGFLTTSEQNWGKHKDTVIDDLYLKQNRAVDAAERIRHLRAFEKRLLDEEVQLDMWLAE